MMNAAAAIDAQQDAAGHCVSEFLPFGDADLDPAGLDAPAEIAAAHAEVPSRAPWKAAIFVSMAVLIAGLIYAIVEVRKMQTRISEMKSSQLNDEDVAFLTQKFPHDIIGRVNTTLAEHKTQQDAVVATLVAEKKERRTGTPGSSEVGSSEVGSSEVGSSEVGSSEVGSSEVGSSEVGAPAANCSRGGRGAAGSAHSPAPAPGRSPGADAAPAPGADAAGTAGAVVADVGVVGLLAGEHRGARADAAADLAPEPGPRPSAVPESDPGAAEE